MWVTKSRRRLSYFHFTACESSMGVCSWVCPGGLGSVPVKARCGGGTVACVSSTQTAPDTQGSHQLGQQDIWCPTGAWLPITVFLPVEFPRQRNLAGHSHNWSDAACMDAGLFYPLAVLPHLGSCMEVAQLLGSWEPWQCWLNMSTGGYAAWVSGTLAVPIVLGHWLPQLQELWPYQSFSSLWQMEIKGPLWLLHPFRHLKSTLAEVLLCCWEFQALKGPTSL